MNRKAIVIVLAVSLLITPMFSLAYAVLGAPKNNEKFQTWHYEKKMNFYNDVIFGGEREYYPSFENPNRMVLTATEHYTYFVITVNGHTYTMGVDFDVEGQVKFAFNNVSFTSPAKLYPSSSKTDLAKVELFLDFSAYPGGIEGTLHILEMGTQAGTSTTSLEGTGDLRNVQVMAVWAAAGLSQEGILTVVDDGTVIGWPE